MNEASQEMQVPEAVVREVGALHLQLAMAHARIAELTQQLSVALHAIQEPISAEEPST